MLYTFQSVKELQSVSTKLDKEIFQAIKEYIYVLDRYYTSQGVDGGKCFVIENESDLKKFEKEYHGVLNNDFEFADRFNATDKTEYMNLLYMAGTEYTYNVCIPKKLLKGNLLAEISQRND